MTMTQEEFSRRFKGSPIKRAKRRGLLRNVAVALGNWGSSAAVPALSRVLADSEPLVRGHAAWALGRIAASPHTDPDVIESIGEILLRALAVESDDWVRGEVADAMAS
jgi:epoxyqueuosine reductase